MLVARRRDQHVAVPTQLAASVGVYFYTKYEYSEPKVRQPEENRPSVISVLHRQHSYPP